MSHPVLLSITNPFSRHKVGESELSLTRPIIPSMVFIAIGQYACFVGVEKAYRNTHICLFSANEVYAHDLWPAQEPRAGHSAALEPDPTADVHSGVAFLEQASDVLFAID